MVDGGDFVAEEPLGARELALRLGEMTLGLLHDTESNRGIRTDPASAATETPDDGLRLLRMGPRTLHMPFLDGDERESRTGECMTGLPTLSLWMLERTHSGRPGFVEVAREIQRMGVGGVGRHDNAVGVRLRELDGATAFDDTRADVAVHGGGTHYCADSCGVGNKAIGVVCPSTLGEPEQTALLERGLSDHGCCGRATDGELGMTDDHVVRKRTDPAQQRPGAAGPDQAQMVLHHAAGHELVVARSGRMLSCFHGEVVLHQPLARASMDLRRRGGLQRRELCRRELRQQRVNAIPGTVLEAGNEQIGTLELRQDR